MIQFAPAVGLEVSLDSYGMSEDLLLEARVGGRAQPVGSRHSIEGSRFRLLLYLAGAIVSLHGPNIRNQLSQRLLIVVLWLVKNPCRSPAVVDKLMCV